VARPGEPRGRATSVPWSARSESPLPSRRISIAVASTETDGAEKRGEYAELCRCPEESGPRVGEQGTKVGQRAYTHEDEQREDAGGDTYRVDLPYEPTCFGNPDERNVGKNPAEPDWQEK